MSETSRVTTRSASKRLAEEKAELTPDAADATVQQQSLPADSENTQDLDILESSSNSDLDETVKNISSHSSENSEIVTTRESNNSSPTPQEQNLGALNNEQVPAITISTNNIETQATHTTQNMAAVKLPAFVREDPDTWFIAVDAILEANNITDDKQKYNCVLTHIESNIILEITDIIKAQPAENKYDNLKTKIIDRFAESSEKQLRRLFDGLALEDRKPSQLLRHMRSLAQNKVGDEALKVKWMALLPIRTQEILQVAPSNSTLDSLATMADKIADTSPTPGVFAVSNTQQLPAAAEVAALDSDTSVKALLIRILQELQSQPRGRSQQQHFNNGAPRRGRSRSRTPSRYNGSCYYHYKFGASAKNCVEPCNFNKSAPTQQQQHQLPQQQQKPPQQQNPGGPTLPN